MVESLLADRVMHLSVSVLVFVMETHPTVVMRLTQITFHSRASDLIESRNLRIRDT